MTLLYLGAGILVVAQIIGIYALVTRKADLIFSVIIAGLLVVAALCGGFGAYSQLH